MMFHMQQKNVSREKQLKINCIFANNFNKDTNMANYSNLTNSIKAVIKQNGTNDITGQLMQDVLVTMTNTIGRFAAFAGTAMPSTNPNNPDQTVYYLTSIPGTYVNFDGIVVPPNRLVALHNIDGAWQMVVVVTFSDGGTISIDPALDPNSVNPVENRIVAGAINALDSRITALESSNHLYEQFVTITGDLASVTLMFTIKRLTTQYGDIQAISQLVDGYAHPITQSMVMDAGGNTNSGYLISAQFFSDGSAKIEHFTSASGFVHHIDTWNIADYSVLGIGRHTFRQIV